MVALNQISIGIFDNSSHPVTDKARIRQHDKAFVILHKAVKLRTGCVMTDTKALHIQVSKGLGLSQFKDMLLARIQLAQVLFHSLPSGLISINIQMILAGQYTNTMNVILVLMSH